LLIYWPFAENLSLTLSRSKRISLTFDWHCSRVLLVRCRLSISVYSKRLTASANS